MRVDIGGVRHVWWLYLLAGCGAVAVYPRFGLATQAVIYDSISALTVVAILLGIALHRPRSRAPWLMFAVGQLMYTAADTLWNYTDLRQGDVPSPSYIDVIYLVYYPITALGLFLLVRTSGWRHQTSLLLDVLLVSVAAVVILWTLVRESVLDPTLPLAARLTNLAYAVGDLALLVPLLRLAIGPSNRSTPFHLLVTSITLTAAADVMYLVSSAEGTFSSGGLADLIWIMAYLAFGAAALHPSMAHLGRRGSDAAFRQTRGRVAIVSSTVLVIPLLVLSGIGSTQRLDHLVVAGGALLFCGALMIRIVAMIRQLEESIGRERILRSAGTDLVGATDHNSVLKIAQRTARRLTGPRHTVEVCHPGQPWALGEDSDEILRIPVEAESAPDLAIVVSGLRPVDPFVVFSLRALGSAVALAWDSVTRETGRRDSEHRWRAIVSSSSDIMLLTGSDSVIRWAGESIHRICGYRPEDLVGGHVSQLLHPDDESAVMEYFNQSLRNPDDLARTDCRLRMADGSYRTFQVTGQNHMGTRAVRGLLFTGLDVTERREMADQLARRAFYDPLTGLANRALFTDRLGRALARDDSLGRASSLLMIGLDGFKTVNESLGHQAGDLILTETAERLNRGLRGTDTAARLGGDEFGILLDDTGIEAAVPAAQRFLATLADSFAVGDHEIYISASIGIVTTDSEHRDARILLRDAEIAMHRAKSLGKGRYEAFRPSMRVDAVRRLELHGDLQRALERNEFVLFYQPIVNLATGRTASFEALVRWRHPTHGLIGPTRFVPFAEETGLVVGLGRWVMGEACRQARQWQNEFSRDLTMAVNLSVRQVADDRLLVDVIRTLEATGMDPGRLTLELTESALMADLDLAAAKLHALRDLGVRIAIDDFGTGYSSLSYLDRLPIDIIKIDRSFVTALDDPSREPTLVRIMVDLGQRLGIPVVAEGIENDGQHQHLRRLGCPLGQGFLFSPPRDSDALTDYLRQQWAPASVGARAAAGDPVAG